MLASDADVSSSAAACSVGRQLRSWFPLEISAAALPMLLAIANLRHGLRQRHRHTPDLVSDAG
jgi:hypothetical protein